MSTENNASENKIIFTDEMITLLYNRVYEFCVARYGEHVDRVEIDEDGIQGVVVTYQCGDTDIDRYYITLDELNNSNLDELREKRLEELRVKNEKARIEREKREAAEKERKTREEYNTYLKLKDKFEQK